MYLISIKSFLRFYQDVGIVVYSDGSLTENDFRIIREHIIGARTVSCEEADIRVREAVNGDQTMIDWRKKLPQARKIVDVAIFAQGRRIILDADTVFMRRPVAIINWIESGHEPFFAWEVKPDLTDANENHPMVAFLQSMKMINDHMGTAVSLNTGFNSGLLGLKEEIKLEKVSRLFEAIKRCKNVDITSWIMEQLMFAYLLSEAKPVGLNDEEYLVSHYGLKREEVRKATFIHFICFNRFAGGFYSMCAKQVTDELRNYTKRQLKETNDRVKRGSDRSR